jgi:hypothetical protein
MRTLILSIALILSTASFASGDHGHSHGHGHGHSHDQTEIKKEETGVIGRTHVQRLVKTGKIDKSWMQSKFDKSEKRNFKGINEWIVTFDNRKGIKGKKLYIFLKLSGEFVAANFTGK